MLRWEAAGSLVDGTLQSLDSGNERSSAKVSYKGTLKYD